MYPLTRNWNLPLQIPSSDTDADSGDATNPTTGAIDVVGIATALAVISLVCAGAVSLKK